MAENNGNSKLTKRTGILDRARKGMNPEEIVKSMAKHGIATTTDYVYKVVSVGRKTDPSIPFFNSRAKVKVEEAPDANNATNDEIKVAEDSTKGGTPAPQSKGPKEEKPAGSALDRLDLQTDHALGLRTILKMTSGAPGPQIAGVLQAVEDEPDRYSKDGMELYSSLQLAGLSNQRAQIATTKWLNRVGSAAEAARFSREMMILARDDVVEIGEKKSSSPLKEMMESMKDMIAFQAQQVSLQMQQAQLEQMRSSMTGGKKEEPKVEKEDRIDKIMDRAEEYTLLNKMVMRDSTGVGPVQGQIVEQRTEYEVVRDAEGNEVKDKSGAVKTRPITVTRTTPIGVPNSAATLDPEEAREERWMNKMYRMNMMKMMSQGMNPMGMDGYGGMGVQPQMERYALLKPDGTPYLDGAGNPIMQVRSLQSPMQQPQQAQMTAKDGFEMAIKVVDAVKPKEDASLAKVLLERSDKAVGRFTEFLVRQIETPPVDQMTQTLDVMAKLKTAGILQPQTDNLEVKKMDNEMRMFELNADAENQRWVAGQQDIRENRVASREQMKEVTETLRDAIKEIGAPIAQNFGAGLQAGMSQPRPAQPAPEQTGPPQTGPSEWSDDELVKQYNKANQVGRVVTDAQVKMREELQKRGIGPGQKAGQAVAPTVSQVPDQDIQP